MDNIFPYVAFRIGGIPIRNTVVATWFVMLFTLGVVFFLRHYRPRLLDMIVEFTLEQLSGMMRIPARPYLPLLGSLMVFLIVANTISIIPYAFAPARDINTPVALAVVVLLAIPFFGVREKGAIRYVKEYSQPAFILPLQLIGDISRIIALVARLFGNVVATELIVIVITFLVPLIVPLPLALLNLITGALHAYIFTVLSAVYISSAVPSSQPREKE